VTEADFEALARALVRHEPNVFWLDAGPGAVSGVSYLGSGARTLVQRNGRVLRDGVDVGDDLLTELRRGLASLPRSETRHPFRGGWVGWFSYEYGADLMGVSRASSDLPEAAFVACERLWALDHATGDVRLVVGTAEVIDAERGGGSPADGGLRLGPASGAHRGAHEWRHSRAEYLRAIEDCLDAIRRGDAYQLCLTNEVRTTSELDPFEVYGRLRRTNPAPYGGFLRIGDVALASSSPERFLSVDEEGTIETRPIKGTRRRDAHPDVDASLAAELQADEKERAENLMIVDLMRNDLGRVAELGSVEVRDLFSIESYATVHQLVSTVSARLAPGRDALDAFAASFPAGSMTGAPKHSAMSILHALEGGPRGVYSGAFGWIGVDGTLDLAMVIRSIVFGAGEARIGTGGGITALSDPAREVDETLLKAAPLLAALGLPVGLPDAPA
jgi:anthranilate synthase component 1